MPIDLKDVLEALPDGVIVIDAGGHVVDSNGEACRILERSAETLAGMPLAEALEAFEPMATQVAAALRDGTAMIAREIGIQSRSGRRSTLDIAVSPLAGGPEGAVITLRDQPVSSELQHLAAQRDRLQAFGHIAAGIAHEVKNPLGGIRGVAAVVGIGADALYKHGALDAGRVHFGDQLLGRVRGFEVPAARQAGRIQRIGLEISGDRVRVRVE